MGFVECRNVRKSYAQGAARAVALDGVSLSIAEGEFVALAGASGSGKTTLLNLIGGLDRPDSGSILLEGYPLEEMSAGQLAELRLWKVGYVFQSYNLIPVLSALENVEFVMLLQRLPPVERRERALAILDEVGLCGKHNRRPAELSGGEQQRVAVARAIVTHPAVVLADEPTANLDSRTGKSLLATMRKLNRSRGITFLFSTHDRLVMSRADRIVHIRDGRVAEEKTRTAGAGGRLRPIDAGDRAGYESPDGVVSSRRASRG